MYNNQGFYSSSNRPEGPPTADLSWGQTPVNLPVPGGVVRKDTGGSISQPLKPQLFPNSVGYQDPYRSSGAQNQPPPPPPRQQNLNQRTQETQDWNQWAPSAVNEQMLNVGGSMARNFISNNVAKYQPGMNIFWLSLKYYFSVDHAYIARKIKLLLFPVIKKNWDRVSTGGVVISNGDSSLEYAKPTFDENAPDLYLPMMSFVTYALITGFVKGRASNFTPDVLIEVLSSAMVVQLLEVLVVRLGVYLLGAATSLLDIISFTGYKFVALCINMAVGLIFGRQAYFIALLYTSLTSAYFMFKTMSCAIPLGSSSREVIMIGFGFLQVAGIWWLGDSKDLY